MLDKPCGILSVLQVSPSDFPEVLLCISSIGRPDWTSFARRLLTRPTLWHMRCAIYPSEGLLRPRVREVRDARNNECHVCARRRDGEPAVPSRRLTGHTPFQGTLIMLPLSLLALPHKRGRAGRSSTARVGRAPSQCARSASKRTHQPTLSPTSTPPRSSLRPCRRSSRQTLLGRCPNTGLF